MNATNPGVEFNFSFAEGATDEQILGFELAGEIWSQYLADTFKGEDLDINIHVEIADDLLPDNIIGGAFPSIKTDLTYEEVYNALVNDVTSGVDRIVADSLLDAGSVDVMVGGEVIDYNYKMQATSANLKAMGLIDGDNQELDGYIVMNSLANAPISWNYNFSDAPQAGTLDFLSTALHEVGHTIGFISGIDASQTESNSASGFWGFLQSLATKGADFVKSGAAAETESKEEAKDFFSSNASSVAQTTVMDLFRYSLESAAQEVTDLTLGKAAFFSIDGEETELALSTGDDYQGSHWINETVDNGLGIMNPTLGLGERWSISKNDLLVMDAIGWDVNYTAELDLEALSTEAQSQIETAWIADRTSNVDTILHTEAYNWAWRSSASSSGSFWWSWRSSTSSSGSFWQSGYWSTYDEATGEVSLSSPTASNQKSVESTTSDSDTHDTDWWWHSSWNWDSHSSWNSYRDRDDDDDDDDDRKEYSYRDRDDDDDDDDDRKKYSYRDRDDDDDDDDDRKKYSYRDRDDDDDDDDDDD